jgi:hypothetical protein
MYLSGAIGLENPGSCGNFQKTIKIRFFGGIGFY